jgi:GntR family colanic acid and biofilm gene transcriptional regulator
VKIQPLEQGNLSARAYGALREALIAGSFGPDERIVMQDLAERLGTSVTPVREACLRLVSEQGLEIRSGRFVTVPALNLARYLEIRIIRTALEGLAAELAASHAQPADLAQLATVQQRFERARLAGDSAEAIKMNRAFHFGVYRLSRIDMLMHQIETMWVSMGPILKVYHEDVVTDYIGADEHVHLIAALAGHDGAAARAALERDIMRGGEGILRYLSDLPKAATG